MNQHGSIGSYIDVVLRAPPQGVDGHRTQARGGHHIGTDIPTHTVIVKNEQSDE